MGQGTLHVPQQEQHTANAPATTAWGRSEYRPVIIDNLSAALRGVPDRAQNESASRRSMMSTILGNNRSFFQSARTLASSLEGDSYLHQPANSSHSLRSVLPNCAQSGVRHARRIVNGIIPYKWLFVKTYSWPPPGNCGVLHQKSTIFVGRSLGREEVVLAERQAYNRNAEPVSVLSTVLNPNEPLLPRSALP